MILFLIIKLNQSEPNYSWGSVAFNNAVSIGGTSETLTSFVSCTNSWSFFTLASSDCPGTYETESRVSSAKSFLSIF